MNQFKGLNVPLNEYLIIDEFEYVIDNKQIQFTMLNNIKQVQFKYCTISTTNNKCHQKTYGVGGDVSCGKCLFHPVYITTFEEWYKILSRSKKLERIINV